MSNPAEEFVAAWLQLYKKQFIMTNIPYQCKSKKGKRMTKEIDILATDGQNGFADYEVKWRTTNWINASKSERIPAIIDIMTNEYRNKAITEIVEGVADSRYHSVRKVLVTPRRHFGKRVFQKRLDQFESGGVELVWFESILSDMKSYVQNSQNKGQYDPTTMSTIRIIEHLES